MISQACKSETITLVATDCAGSTHRHQLLPNQGVFVGSSSNCGLQLGGDGLSDIHCRIELDNGKIWVQDWMSATGTQINGETITTKAAVQTADSIQIGQYRLRLSTDKPQEKMSKPESGSMDESVDQDWNRAAVDPQNVSQEGAVTCPPDPQPTSHSFDERPRSVVDESESVSDEPGSMDIDVDFFQFEEEETFDHETVALLHAEIEDLQAALAQRDAEHFGREADQEPDVQSNVAADSDAVLQRMQELIDEANRSDERVAILEEMLFVAEEANQSQQDERNQLEAWVGDIEKRIGQRESEYQAEINALRQRMEESNLQRDRLQKQLQLAARGGNAPEHYEQTLENLQARNRELQEKMAESEQERLTLSRRLAQQSDEQEQSLRAERVSLAQEKAKVSRLRFELSNKLSDIEEVPKTENSLDKETVHKIRTLREHLREIHEQEKREEKEASIATRLAKLWKRVEY